MDNSLRHFLYPTAKYSGPVKPDQMVINANLQEFAQRVTYISNLNTNGKLTADEAFQQISQLWNTLQRSKAGLKKAFTMTLLSAT